MILPGLAVEVGIYSIYMIFQTDPVNSRLDLASLDN
jgi:hypothetical protein